MPATTTTRAKDAPVEQHLSPRRPTDVVVPDKQTLAIPRASLEWIAADAFTTDQSYDRPPQEGRINYLAENWKDEALGVVFASRRDGADKLFLLDGQHRVGALKKQGRKTELVPTLVFDGLSVPEEAQLFVMMNKNRRALTPSELFKASLVEGDKGAIEIKAVMEGLGLELESYGASPYMVRCVSSVWRIYRAMGAAGVDATLSLILVTWGDPPPKKAFNDRLVLVIARILFFGEGRVDVDRLRRTLATDTPDAWLSKAATIRAMSGGDRTHVIGDVILGAYNKGLPQTKHVTGDLLRQRKDPFNEATRFRRAGTKAGEVG